MHERRLATTQSLICLYAEKTELVDEIKQWADSQDIEFQTLEVGENLSDVEATSVKETIGITLGGDGTFLEGVRVFSPRNIPMIGVNQGTLAFLARIPPEKTTNALTEAVTGKSDIDARQQVSVQCDELNAMGVNDIMIQPTAPENAFDRKVVSLDVYVDDEYVGDYTGSGLAVATPTGSTGLALSAGGPIQHPSNNRTLQITPLHTHNIGVRPLIVDANQNITVVSDDEVQVLVDGGRHSETIGLGTEIHVTGADQPAHIVRSQYESTFFDAISEKLGWGLRSTNVHSPVETVASETDFLSDALSIGVEAAESAGESLRELHGHVESIEYKQSKSDIVTEADYRAEQIITQTLRNEFPTHSIHSEESVHYVNDQSSYTWIVDPLDGTGNFAHGNPNYSISLALVEDGELKVAVVYSPETDERFTAIANRGAWVDDSPIAVTDRESLDESMLISGYDPNGDFIEKFYEPTRGIRAIGSASLNLCYVAIGAADGLWEYDTYPWDVAAGLLIVQEAGGTVTDVNGNPFSLSLNEYDERQPLLATNGGIHEQVLQRMSATFD